MKSRFIKSRPMPKQNNGACLDQNNDGNCSHNSYLHKGNGLIDLSQIESGNEIFQSIEDLIKAVEELENKNYLVSPVKFEDLESELKYKINNLQEYDDTFIKNQIQELRSIKVNRFELAAYRKIDVPIERSDLSEELQDIIYSMEHNGYDDRWVREQIDLLKTSKMDKAEDVRFRKVDEFIKIDDLDESLKQLIGEISENTTKIYYLEETKADREELNNYRHKAIEISYNDLDKKLKAMLDTIEVTDNSIILAKLAELDAKKVNRDELDLKADKAELEDYRRVNVAIKFEDLDAYLQSILDQIPTDFDPTVLQFQINELKEVKVDKSELANYRSKAVLIGSSDLSKELNNRIDAGGGSVDLDDVWKKLNDLETRKADLEILCEYLKDVEGVITEDHLNEALKVVLLNKANVSDLDSYRHKSVKILIEDLGEEVINLIKNNDPVIEEILSWIESAQEELDGILEDLQTKAGIDYVDGTFRRLDTKISEYDLDDLLRNKINSVLSGQNLLELTEKVEYLLTASSDISTEIRLARGGNATLKEAMDSKLAISEAEAKYRSKEEPITEDDLSGEIQEKLNGIGLPHNNLLGLNDGDEYLHITRDEYETFIGYEKTIKDLVDRVVELEKIAGIQVAPYIKSTSIDSNKGAVPIDIGSIQLHTSDTGTVIEDPSLITMEPNVMIGEPSIENGIITINVRELIGISRYTIKVKPGAIKAKDLVNEAEFELTFKTELVETLPVIEDCMYNGSEDVPLNIDLLTFQVTHEIGVVSVNPELIEVGGDILNGEITLSNNRILIPISNLVENTAYTITFRENAVLTERGSGNREKVNTFSTKDIKTKPIISNCNLHAQSNIELDINEITFDVTCEEEIILEDPTKYSIEPEIDSEIELRESQLVITLNEELVENTAYLVTLDSGLVRDGDDLVNDKIVNTFRTKDIKYKPELVDIDGINGATLGCGNTILNIEVVSKGVPTLVDSSLIVLAPNSLTSTPYIEDGLLKLPAKLLEHTEYTLTIAEGSIRDGVDLYNDEFVVEFITGEEITAPVVTSCNVQDKNDVDINLGEIIFDVEFSEELRILDDVFITIEPNVKKGKCLVREGKLIMPINQLTEKTQYSVKVDANALKDGDDLPNTQIYTTKFSTSEPFTKPIISDSSLNGLKNVSLDTEKITFPVIFNESLNIVDESLVTVEPNVKDRCVIEDNCLVIYFTKLSELTSYTVTIGEGAIQDGDDLFNDQVVNKFSTEENITKPIIGNCEINGREDVDYETLETLTFPITVGEGIVEEDLSQITISPNILFGEPRIEESTLILDVTNVRPNTTYTVSIPQGVIRDGDDLVNEGMSNIFKTRPESETPEVSDEVEWEYKVTLEGIDNSFISYEDIRGAVSIDELTEVLFYSNNEEEYLEGNFAPNPPIQVQYMGSEANPLEEGIRIPRTDIDNGEICPEIPEPSYKPAGDVENYTMGSYIPDVDGIRFKSSPILSHIIRVVKYISK